MNSINDPCGTVGKATDPYTQLLAELQHPHSLKALTLTQPWATLMAVGAKHIETRSWSTTHRGLLAIHAAKGFPAWAEDICQEPFVCGALLDAGYVSRGTTRTNPRDLPLGQVVAIASLDRVERITQSYPVTKMERAFGDYRVGRFAWHFSAIYRLTSPIAARGSLGLWTWDPPVSFWEAVRAAGHEQVQPKETRS